jgi:L,D-transpeptidase ErfK/SrfK
MRASVGVCALAVLLSGISSATQETADVSEATTGGSFAYVIERGDTLAVLAARFGIDRAVMARENGLAPNATLVIGQLLALDNGHIVPAGDAGILVNVPQRMLFHVAEGLPPSGYPVAVGRRDWPTPRGSFQVVAKEQDPTWDVPRSIQEEMRRSGQRVVEHVPPGPGNPLGEFWFGLSLPGIGIHGTSAPTSIYRPVTHGCIRLHPDAARELFFKVPIGATGRILYEPVLLAVIDGTVFLEAHPDVYRLSGGDRLPAIGRALERLALGDSIDWSAARDVLTRRDGVARAIGESAGAPQQADERSDADPGRNDETGRRNPGQNPR